MWPPYPPERFDKLAAELMRRSSDVMVAKRAEYSPGADRLKNFHVLSVALDVLFGIKLAPAEVAIVLWLKHIQGVGEAVQRGEIALDWVKEGGGEGLAQRFADIINYVYLIYAALDESQGAGAAEA